MTRPTHRANKPRTILRSLIISATMIPILMATPAWAPAYWDGQFNPNARLDNSQIIDRTP